MRKTLIAAAIALAGVSGAGIAQGMGGMSAAGSMSASDVGMSPLTGTPSPTFVKMAAASDMFEINSSKIALMKSKNPQVKQFAQQMITDHTTTTNALKAALPQTNPKVPAPPMMLPPDKKQMIATLKSTPAAQFDQVYLQQQMQSHQMAWALHKGYSTDGQDPALRQVASQAVPIVEQHLQMLKSMPGTTSAGAM